MSETNLEHYKKELEKILNEEFANTSVVFDKVKKNCDSNISSCCWTTYTRDILEWMSQPYKGPILEEDERKYLSDVIRPFRNKVEYIAKFKSACSENEQYIHILFYEGHYLSFPYFKANSMYKGMKLNKAYTLKELGL